MLDNVSYGGANPTRIAVSSIPWETSDVQFKQHFMQFGDVEYAEIVRDRQGRSKGFGFVSFSDPNVVRMVLATQHLLDNRRIDVKIDSRDVNRNRVFVARIPDTMSEIDFRNYFEKFGRVQDAYMPRDHTKQGYRGIGFVTYDEAETVDRVIKIKHMINGVEVAVDRAIIKGDIMRPPTSPTNLPMPTSSQEHAMQQLQRGLLTMNMHGGQGQGLAQGFSSPPPQTLPNIVTEQAPSIFSFSEESFSPTSTGSGGGFLDRGQHFVRQQLPHQSRYSPHIMHAHFAHPHSGPSSPVPPQQADYNIMQQVAQQQGLIPDARVTSPDMIVREQTQIPIDNPGPASARAGPRIFVGKLSKDTTEQDVREYFQSFGFVLDVYMPKNKDNKKEHRGFGFITFETDASIKRVVSHGMHRIRGANIAIDVAVPRKEDALLRPLSPMSPTGVASPQPGVNPMDRLPVDLAQIMGAQSPDVQLQELQLQQQGIMQHFPSSAQNHPHSYQTYGQ